MWPRAPSRGGLREEKQPGMEGRGRDELRLGFNERGERRSEGAEGTWR